MCGKTKSLRAFCLLAILLAALSSCGGSGNTPTGEGMLPPVTGDALYMERPPEDGQPKQGSVTGGYQPVSLGENELDINAWYEASNGASTIEFLNRDYMFFTPAGDQLNFLHYAVEGIPAGERINAVRLLAKIGEDEPQGSGIYIAWANYETGSFSWHGPFHDGGEIKLFNSGERNVSAAGRGHILIGVSGTEGNVLAGELSVNIGHGFMTEMFEPALDAKLP